MLIRFHMARDLVTVSSDTSCREALALMKSHSIRRLPVVDDGKLTGIVTERDLFRYLPWSVADAEFDSPVSKIVAREPITVHPSDPIEVAALLMLDERVGGLPVLEDGKLVGLITESDLFRAIVELRSPDPGSRILLRVKHQNEDPILRTCLSMGAHIQSIMRMPFVDGQDHVSLQVECRNVDALIARLSEQGCTIVNRTTAA